MDVLAVDIGATRTKWGVFERGVLRQTGVEPTPSHPEALVQLIAAKAVGVKRIGLAFAGFLSGHKIAFCPNLPGFQGFELARAVGQATGVQTLIANDADCFALGEALLGAARTGQVVLGITLGTGIGSGLVIHGKIYRGAGFAGEIGHLQIDPQGPVCNCGRKGCLEAFIGEARFSARFGYPSAKHAFEAKDTRAWDFYGEKLGTAIADAVNLLDPDTVVLGGGVSRAFELFGPSMLEQIRSGVVDYDGRNIKLTLSELGPWAGLYGGFALVSQNGN